MLTVEEIGILCDTAIPAASVDGGRRASFQLPQLARALVDRSSDDDPLRSLRELREAASEAVSDRYALRLLQSVLRTSFLVEPVALPGAETTLFTTRWSPRLAGDSRSASVEECCAIADLLSTKLTAIVVGNGADAALLAALAQDSAIPYELPFDYIARLTPIHRAANFQGLDPEVVQRAVGIRRALLDVDVVGDELLAVMRATYYKVWTKSYKTDRVLTGAHKTNREKRWECVPDSVHFALRRHCMEIELLLMNQLCHFEEFPAEVKTHLLNLGLLLPCSDPFRCPVTLDPMNFTSFADATSDRRQGVSIFHVGHLDPLKLEGNTFTGGHSAGNISWISEDGNRIQGSLSISKTREMLERIWCNYVEAGLFVAEAIIQPVQG